MKPRKTIFAAVPLAILLLPVGIYIADRATSTQEVARNVTIDGIPVGGMTRADATLAVESYENQLRTNTGVFAVNGATFKLSPISIDLTADVRSAVDAAFLVRRDGGVFANFSSWISSFSTSQDAPLSIAFDHDAIEQIVAEWETDAIPNPAYNGNVSVVDGVITPNYPKAGQSLNRDAAHGQVVAEMSTLDKAGVTLEVIDSTPILTNADVDAAAAEMAQMIDSSITMISAEVGFRTTFRPEQLSSAVRADLSPAGTELIVSFDADRVLEILEPRRTEYEIEPIDAQFDIDLETDEFTIVPGRSGTLLDTERLLSEMKTTALGSDVGEFPLLVGAEPSFTTEAASSFTTLGPLAGFTTEHPANQARVTNIQLMADAVNGAIVLPGEEWSINDHVGQRTEAKGYIAAPAIINGAPYCCDNPANIGGGVSQFGTTLYNAVFYSCLDDVDHTPHSLYFTRYPMGREATLGFPNPDVRFGNNTEYPIVIATAYTDTSITVKMYGDNGGLTCTDDTHDPEDIVEYTEELVADEEGVLNPGERTKIRSGINGFLIKVDRIVTYPDGQTERDLDLVHRYRTLSEQYMVNPCEVSGEPVDCPVKLASVVNQTWESALESLSEAGLFAARVTEVVNSAAKDGIVLSQDPAPGEWVGAGVTITLTVGVYNG
ncbi:MAG: VanW family protein [Acidimicrobiia bacterium]|nr:MAG: VanW family protein [Acidimicrobiia bacterium]